MGGRLRFDRPASAAPAVLVGVLTPLGLATPSRDKPLVVVLSALANPGAVVQTINRGYNQSRLKVSTINDLSSPNFLLSPRPLTEVLR